MATRPTTKKTAAKRAPRKAPGKKAPAERKAPGKKTPRKRRAPSRDEPAKKKAPGKPPTPPAKAPRKALATAPSLGRAPEFRLADQRGATIRSSDLRGGPYVLYFYPKDDTPGCTAEACDFRDALAAFRRAGVRVLGVSPDSTPRHAAFAKKYGLPFTLLADSSRVLAEAYGVYVKKRLYGREYMGIERSTFLIDGNGKILRQWRGVRVPGHVKEVLAAAREVQS